MKRPQNSTPLRPLLDLDRVMQAGNVAWRAVLILLPLVLCSCSEKCNTCGGSGKTGPIFFKKICETCGGTGEVPQSDGFVGFVIVVVLLVVLGKVLVTIAKWLWPIFSEFHANRNRNIFIIGPEGSGKTTFLAALSRLANTHPGKLVMEPSDFESSKFVTKALEALNAGEWPKSNPEGDLKVYHCRLGHPDKTLHNVTLFDYSGQDMRKILLDDDSEQLEKRLKELRGKIDDSDILIFLFDFDGLIRSSSLSETNENFWLLSTFLTRPSWKKKHRLLVATKADLYEDLIAESGGDLREAISRQLSGVPGGSNLKHHLAGVKCFQITSILTQSTLDEGSNPRRVPRTPLSSKGLKPLVTEILALLNKG